MMTEQFYLFLFEDNTSYEMTCGISLKDAVYEMSKYTGNSSELFRKCLFSKEIGENDVEDMIALFNHFCYYSRIDKIYIVKEKIWENKSQ